MSSSKRLFKKLISRLFHLARMFDIRLNTKNLRNIISDTQADNLNTGTLQILFDISQKFGIGAQTVRDQKDNFAGLSSTDKLSGRRVDRLSDRVYPNGLKAQKRSKQDATGSSKRLTSNSV